MHCLHFLWTPESLSSFLHKQVHEPCAEFLATCGKRCMVEKNESSEANQTVKAYWAGECKDFFGDMFGEAMLELVKPWLFVTASPVPEDIHAAIAVADAQYDQKKVMVQNLARGLASITSTSLGAVPWCCKCIHGSNLALIPRCSGIQFRWVEAVYCQYCLP